MTSTIWATRQGFIFQDKYALWCFLKHFLAKEEVELFIDFPFDNRNQRSIDVKIIITQSSGKIERICGIKSGESFKKNQAVPSTSQRASSTQIRDAFEELRIYKDTLPTTNTALEMQIIVSPPLKDQIALCWAHLSIIEGKQNYTGAAKNSADWLHDFLKLTGFSTAHRTFQFLKLVKIKDSSSNFEDSITENGSPLDDAITSKLQKLERGFGYGVSSTSEELPTDLLYHELLFICQKNAGTGADIGPLLINAILDFFARREMINRPSGSDYESAIKKVEGKYKTWKESLVIVTREQLDQQEVSSDIEGGTISE